MAATSLFTLADLTTQVCLNLGATDDLSQLKAQKNINRALIRFSEMGIWSWQRVYNQAFPGATSVTVAGTSDYSVRNCLEMHSLYFDPTSSQVGRILLMGDREFRRLYSQANASGRPYLYLERGRVNSSTETDVLKIGLYPIPDAAYTIKWDGIKPISLLSATTDDVREITGMPVSMVDVLIEMATAIGWKEIDDAQASEQMQEVMLRLKGMYQKDNHSIEDCHVFRPFAGDDFYRDPTLPANYSRD